MNLLDRLGELACANPADVASRGARKLRRRFARRRRNVARRLADPWAPGVAREVALVFTGVSIARSYTLRRLCEALR
jgi:hypothetical protein